MTPRRFRRRTPAGLRSRQRRRAAAGSAADLFGPLWLDVRGEAPEAAERLGGGLRRAGIAPGACFTSVVADPHLDTALQRPPTGLDEGARALVLRVLSETSGGDVTPSLVASAFFRDRFGGPSDYLDGVAAVWGDERRFRLQQAISGASTDAQFSPEWPRRTTPEAASAQAMLLQMPEPDFRTAVEAIVDIGLNNVDERITAICRSRGAPWAFSDGRFEYVGDEQVERDLIRPALAAIDRQEFSGGVRQEFEAARAELAKGRPGDLKQAIVEAGAAVESAMKVVLDSRGTAFDPRDTAASLFDHLKSAGIVPNHMKDLVLVAMVPRNKVAAHGAGAVAHAVGPDEAEAIVAGAGGAISYLATLLT